MPKELPPVPVPTITNGKVNWGPAKGGGNKPAYGKKGNFDPNYKPDPTKFVERRRKREQEIAEKALDYLEAVIVTPVGSAPDAPSHRDKIAASTYTYDKAFGKATQQSEVTVRTIDPNTVSDEELMQIAKSAHDAE